MTSLPDPLLTFHPILKERVWGGTALAAFGIELPTGRPFGEAWLLADLPASIEDGRSVFDAGTWQGRTIDSVIKAHRIPLLGGARPMPDGSFPLLVKLLAASENLSVQVHPTVEYARAHPGAAVKNESWIILKTEPGARLYIGLRDGIRRDEFIARVRDGTIEQCLRSLPARVGDCHHLASGVCHALGGGVVVAEVQTPSDTTFRIHDWGRQGRQMHVTEAVECIFGTGDEVAHATAPTAAARPILSNGVLTTRLVATKDYSIERVEAAEPTTLPLITNGQPVILLGLDGTAVVSTGGAERDRPTVEPRPLWPGRLVLIPACSRGCEVRMPSDSVLLRIELPSPMDLMLA